MIITLPAPDTLSAREGLRPVNLRTDLAPLADLIELVFASTMDDSGRAAIQEMRTMSRMGSALGLLGRLNDLMLGISLGYVWIADGRLVGNVSIYPANYPPGAGKAWIIANVGVHPEYQRRGIAYQLMRAALHMIAEKGGQQALLQVDYENTPAIELYLRLGFVQERAFTTWARSSGAAPPPQSGDLFLTRRRPAEWQQEYTLAQHTRPADQGGVGWLRPLHVSLFHRPLWQRLWDALTLSSMERLVIRSDDDRQLRAVAWVENTFAASRTRITLLAQPGEASAAEALLGNILRRFRGAAFSLEHPYDDTSISHLLYRLRFQPERTVWHMRYNF
ncbi:MAG: GNAT family N-acetyltransferase [Anaerolineae bacterium]|nr:GNAT family N-acetyltransferase [Anaerolineae bacterium]